MKNVLKAFGIIAFLALIGFSMVACSDDSGGGGGGGLAGTTWTYTGTSGSMTLTFTDSTVRLVYPGNSENGTYTFNGSSGTVRWSDGTSNPFTVSGNSLTIDGVTFTKTGGGSTPSGGSLAGTRWVCDPEEFRFTASEYTWGLVGQGQSGIFQRGTYTFDGRSGTMRSTEGTSAPFTVNGNKLDYCNAGTMIYTKQ
jgi:hypothetical protein